LGNFVEFHAEMSTLMRGICEGFTEPRARANNAKLRGDQRNFGKT
jgi:hypothetical protein